MKSRFSAITIAQNTLTQLDNRDPSTFDFTEDWSSYWVQRIQVYYNKALKQIIDAVGAKYVSTISEITGNTNDKETTPPQINAEAFVLGNSINILKIYSKLFKTTIIH